jgi:acetyltransferase (GNAT) family protein
LPPACGVDGCGSRAQRGHTHCWTHIRKLRDVHGRERCCAGDDGRCIRPRQYWSHLCPEHHEMWLRRPKTRDTRVEWRLVAPPAHRHPVPGLTVVYSASADPGSRPYRIEGPDPVRHQVDGDRVREYYSAYVDEIQVGHLALWLHPGGTAFLKMIEVDFAQRRRGIASALYETFRHEHPDVLVDHGSGTDYGSRW